MGKEYTLKCEGNLAYVEERDVVKRNLSLEAFFDQIGASKVANRIAITDVLDGWNLCCFDERKVWFKEIDFLTFRSFYADGTAITPVFGHGHEVIAEKRDWVPLKDMKLVLAMNEEPYLFAFDEKFQAYRLPTANVYNDCKICMTDRFKNFKGKFVNRLKLLESEMESSEWNSDLLGKDGDEKARRLFRWVLEGDNLVQETSIEWKQLSMVVSHHVVEAIRYGLSQVLLNR